MTNDRDNPANSEPPKAMEGSLARVLIVDDDDGIRRSLARIMRCRGFEVATACDGESALVACREFQPDLLLLDIRMPGIDGVEAFRMIRKDHPGVSAIFMTAYSSSARVSEAIELGAYSVLSKPLDINTLGRLVEEAVEKSPVLIVDDDAGFLNQIAVKVQERGIQIATTRSMATAVESLRRRPKQVVLVIGRQVWPDPESYDQYAQYVQWIPKPIDVDAVVSKLDELTKAKST